MKSHSLPVRNLHFELTHEKPAITGFDHYLLLRVWAKDLETVVRKHEPIYQWTFPLHHKFTAERLLDAIAHGVVFKSYRVEIDANGDTYYAAEMTQPFSGKHMDAALRQVGY